MEGSQQGRPHNPLEEAQDDDEKSNSTRSQRTSTSVSHSTKQGSGLGKSFKKNTGVLSDVNGGMIEELQDHGVGLGDMDAWLSGVVSFGKMLEGLVNGKRIVRSAGAALLLKYHGKRVNGEAPEVVACNSLSTGSSLSGCSVETGVKNHELRMAEQARSQQGSSAGRELGKVKVDNGMIQQVFRYSLWPEFKFVFSNAETEGDSDLAKAYYSCMDIRGHFDRYEHWTKAMAIGRRALNDKRSSVTGTMKETFIRKLTDDVKNARNNN
jgi:hypothetical protein